MIYDPLLHVRRPESSLTRTPLTALVELVGTAEGTWFARDVWTGGSLLLEALPPPLRAAAQLHIGVESALADLRVVCEAETLVPLPCGVLEVSPTVHEEMAAARLRKEGVAPALVEAALRGLCGPLSLDALLAGVEVVELPATPSSVVEGVEDPYSLRAVFVLGAGGTGKTLISKEMFAGLGLRFIDQDKYLEQFMKDVEMPLSQVGSRYDLLKKAQSASKREFKHFSGARAGLVVNVTGWDFKRVAVPVRRLRSLGYDVFMLLVGTTLETALQRNAKRDRVVPPFYVARAHNNLWASFPRYRHLMGPKNMLVIKNDTDLSPEDWKMRVGPELRKHAMAILTRPLKNKTGLEWLRREREAKVLPQAVEVVSAVRPFAS